MPPSNQLSVLMISDVYFPRINGVSTSIETFRESLAKLDVRVRLVVPEYPQAHADGPETWRVSARTIFFDPEDRLMRYRNASALLSELCAEQPPDLIHVQTPFVAHYAGLHLARQLDRPLVATCHTLFEEYAHAYLPWLPEWLLRACARAISRRQGNDLATVIVPSSAMRARLLDYGVRVPTVVVPTGIRPECFAGGDGARFRARLGLDAGCPVALFVGRVAHEKNIGFLLDVAAWVRERIPEFVLVIAGEGPARPALEARTASLDMEANVRFVGYLDRRQELPDCYAAADVFVFASRTETQGLVLLEAMAAGVPVLALAEMGTRDILEPAHGALIAPDDVGGFADALVALLRDPGERRRLQGAAREDAAAWSADAQAGRLVECYRQVVAAHRHGA